MFFYNEPRVNSGWGSFLSFFAKLEKERVFFVASAALLILASPPTFFLFFFSWRFKHPLCPIHRDLFMLWLTSSFTLHPPHSLTQSQTCLLMPPRPTSPYHFSLVPQRAADESASLFFQMFMSSRDRQPMSASAAGACGCSVTWRASRRRPISFSLTLPSFIHPSAHVWQSSQAPLECARPFIRQQWFAMNTSALTWRTHAETRVSAVCQEFKAAKSVWVQP